MHGISASIHVLFCHLFNHIWYYVTKGIKVGCLGIYSRDTKDFSLSLQTCRMSSQVTTMCASDHNNTWALLCSCYEIQGRWMNVNIQFYLTPTCHKRRLAAMSILILIFVVYCLHSLDYLTSPQQAPFLNPHYYCFCYSHIDTKYMMSLKQVYNHHVALNTSYILWLHKIGVDVLLAVPNRYCIFVVCGLGKLVA